MDGFEVVVPLFYMVVDELLGLLGARIDVFDRFHSMSLPFHGKGGEVECSFDGDR